MTIRTEMASFEMAKLLMLDRSVDGTVVVTLEGSESDARGGQRAGKQQLVLTGASAKQAWEQVTQHAATRAGTASPKTPEGSVRDIRAAHAKVIAS